MLRKWILIAAAATSTPALAFDFVESTFLIELEQGSVQSDKVQSLRGGSYESATGAPVRFDKWYSNSWTDTRIAFMTKVAKNAGITWGFSTGEVGRKYKIDPSFKVGIVFIQDITKTSMISLNASYTLGGRLREKACTADYGDIGGVQSVNCRLAATPLPPNETLQYMINERPYNYKTVTVQFNYNF